MASSQEGKVQPIRQLHPLQVRLPDLNQRDLGLILRDQRRDMRQRLPLQILRRQGWCFGPFFLDFGKRHLLGERIQVLSKEGALCRQRLWLRLCRKALLDGFLRLRLRQRLFQGLARRHGFDLGWRLLCGRNLGFALVAQALQPILFLGDRGLLHGLLGPDARQPLRYLLGLLEPLIFCGRRFRLIPRGDEFIHPFRQYAFRRSFLVAAIRLTQPAQPIWRGAFPGLLLRRLLSPRRQSLRPDARQPVLFAIFDAWRRPGRTGLLVREAEIATCNQGLQPRPAFPADISRLRVGRAAHWTPYFRHHSSP